MFKKFGYAAALVAVVALSACNKVENAPVDTAVEATDVPTDAQIVEVPADENAAANTSAK